MKFTIETEPFRRMLVLLTQAPLGGRRRHARLQLEASGDRLRVNEPGLTAEIEAVVWQEGRCTVPAERLTQAIESCRRQPSLQVQGEEHWLRVGNCLLTCAAELEPNRKPAPAQIFFAGHLGVEPSATLPPLSLAVA